MKRYGNVKMGDKTFRPGCPCCTKKYSFTKHRGGKKRARQNAKIEIRNNESQ